MAKYSKYIIAIICSSIVIFRIIFPKINFDLISLTLVAIATFALLIKSPEKLFKNTKSFKLGSFELELKELNEETEKVEESIVSEKKGPIGLTGPNVENNDKIVYEISNDFNVEILKISILIEKTLREIYEIHFKSKQEKPFAINKLIDKLREENVIDNETTYMLKRFWEVRNNVVHNHSIQIDKKDFMSFIDIGIRILKILINIKNDKLDGKMEHYVMN